MDNSLVRPLREDIWLQRAHDKRTKMVFCNKNKLKSVIDVNFHVERLWINTQKELKYTKMLGIICEYIGKRRRKM